MTHSDIRACDPIGPKQEMGCFCLKSIALVYNYLLIVVEAVGKLPLAGSRFLRQAETRFAPVEGEALAIAWSLEQTRYFTQGCDRLIVVTDQKPLLKLFGDRTLYDIANPRLFRLKQGPYYGASRLFMPRAKVTSSPKQPLGNLCKVITIASNQMTQ